MLHIAIAIAGIATPFAVLALRYRARQQAFIAKPITDADRRRVRDYGRRSVRAFIGFWIVAIALVAAVESIAPSAFNRSAAYLALGVAAVMLIGFQLSIRCPACDYRLGFQRTLSTPPSCERCGARFS